MVRASVAGFGALAGAVAALVVAAVALLHVEPGTYLSPDAVALAQVRKAVEMKTLMGPYVFPGTENMKATEAPVYRSGYVPMTDSLNAALSDLLAECRHSDCSVETAYWLTAGYIAAGRLNMARNLLVEANRRFPRDDRFAVLRALLAWEQGDSQAAVNELRSVVVRRPADGVSCVDLAWLLLRQGEVSSAHTLLKGLRDIPVGTLLYARLNDILASPGSSDEVTH